MENAAAAPKPKPPRGTKCGEEHKFAVAILDSAKTNASVRDHRAASPRECGQHRELRWPRESGVASADSTKPGRGAVVAAAELSSCRRS